ncbi:hypothetical protein Mc24_03423 [Thermotoga sp. Mc24]|nr:hypothetical protein Mc24_03423 [Thermotoga sp. Mc24]
MSGSLQVPYLGFHTSKELLKPLNNHTMNIWEHSFHTSKELLKPVSLSPRDADVFSFHTSKELLKLGDGEVILVDEEVSIPLRNY